jgi:hypothetical protein
LEPYLPESQEKRPRDSEWLLLARIQEEAICYHYHYPWYRSSQPQEEQEGLRRQVEPPELSLSSHQLEREERREMPEKKTSLYHHLMEERLVELSLSSSQQLIICVT